MSKTKRMTRITAGRLVSAVVYTQATSADPSHVRRAKSKMSNEARAKQNRRLSWQKLEGLIAANFRLRRDLWVTLTYDDDHVPSSRQAALTRLDRFMRSLRADRRAHGGELRYIKNVESVTAAGEPTRLHHHCIINAFDNDYEVIRSLWPWGSAIDIEVLGGDGEAFGDIARYMAKERPPVGSNSWTPSRGLKRPRRESYMVDESMSLAAPPGAVILERAEDHNAWGEFYYIKYLLPG